MKNNISKLYSYKIKIGFFLEYRLYLVYSIL